MVAYLLLAGAVFAEVTGTVALKFSEGFSKLGPSIVVVAGYVTAFLLLAQVLKAGLPVGVAYGIWAAAGVALVATVGALFLGETMTPLMIGGVVLVIAGVLLLELGRSQ
ncbi:QacE family quaternary ammonium compound efflux SMR transporter [Amycolatopsis antarctica]|uniref:QacE family quaternary ammonium compound efflux SMR transporter n=1 Tax=Amycolatopsis antarctica TaxID=1854586 RepID=A0A263CYX9_9PSEU|nr:multidrug efflux SMR transporter [Amycolatopsis antarctica]OZM71380.1 QacE family quaternary ammonium compound efflux SMR transporter [Amycolatopsis antarctica]